MSAAPVHNQLLRWRGLLPLAMLVISTTAHADWVIPAGATSDLVGGAAHLGCTDLHVAGTLIVGAGGSVTEVRAVFVAPGGQIQLQGGRIELAQQWDNQGTLDAAGGQVLRVNSAGCPAAGPLGPVAGAGTTPVAVPTLGATALAWLAALLGGLGLQARRRMRRIGN